MVTISINGKKQDREFPNMAHALAFAYQNGECHAAQKLEIVCTAEKAKPEPAKPSVAGGGGGTGGNGGGGKNTGTGGTGAETKLEEMNAAQKTE